MSRIAYVSDEPISIPHLIDTDALLRGARAAVGAVHNSLRMVVKFLGMWYL